MSAADFDFLHGRWHVHHRKIADIVGGGTEWVEFSATTEVWPVLGGIGNVENHVAPDFEGMPLRLYDTGRDVWRIWWASTRQPGHLDPPVEGRFTDGRGVFLGEGTVGGRPVQVRFDWTLGEVPVWEQSFSYDDGVTWAKNWIMTFTRPSTIE